MAARLPYRTLQPGQRCVVHVYDAAARTSTPIAEFTDVLLEAPNWAADGEALYVNGQGRFWRLALGSGAVEEVPFEGLPPINNDHVLGPAGSAVYLSANDRQIYRGSLAGGPVQRVTEEDGTWHYLHGVSPDGGRLAFVQIAGAGQPGRLALIPAQGGAVTVVDTGPGHIDGPEWSPDGRWIYFNSERWAEQPGHAQLARVSEAGEVERLRTTGTVDWFPHLSPDGQLGVYLQFPTGTQGHPADKPVQLVVVSASDWTQDLDRFSLPGGQGTINVNSWSPDSRRFAYVSYPMS